MTEIVCVTGAGGFVGAALCRALLKKDVTVRAIGRNEYPHLQILGAQIVKADLRDGPETLAKAFEGATTVFHVASKVDMWGDYKEFYEVNVKGTANVIAACKAAAVKNIIYTSSPSVVADGNDLCNVDESYPIPSKHMASYPATKAIAERMVLEANAHGLNTVALRPHLIFGPGDRHFLPTILDRARQGRMLIVGSGNNVVDVCYIDDCVDAHIKAWEAFRNNRSIGGKAFFISQGDPIKLWDFVAMVLKLNGLPPLRRRVSKTAAQLIAAAMELACKISPLKLKPLFTRFLVSEMSSDHYFNISSARDLLSFNPELSVVKALELTFPSGAREVG